PYSVSGKLLEKIAIYSAHNGIPITIHISESEEEVQFLKEGSSALRGFLEKRGALPHSWQPVGTTPVSYLHGINFLSPKTLGVHLNYLTDGDISILNKINMPIVHCPRSTRYFGRHKCHPCNPEQFNIALGTDSLASNDSLNMLDEMKLLKETFNIPADTILKMATINGAKALGLNDKIGTLEYGKCADIIALRKVKGSTSFPAIEGLFESLLKDTWEVSLVIVDGKILKNTLRRNIFENSSL
ncbi:MAG: amidohydrolase family protein, partial [Candidatus Omnitrophica bacterium]|nr:amidohydrolase family protein [Candidatus Omnitrophota bacterium]